jgi:hypothetical protein
MHITIGITALTPIASKPAMPADQRHSVQNDIHMSSFAGVTGPQSPPSLLVLATIADMVLRENGNSISREADNTDSAEEVIEVVPVTHRH